MSNAYKNYLRSLNTIQLEHLLSLRPELTMPTPRDMDELVERICTRAATQAGMEGLNAWQLRVLTALAAAGDADVLAENLGVSEEDVETAIEDLRERALVWGKPARIAQQVNSVLGPFPAGLARPSTEQMAENKIAKALANMGEAEHKVLARLVWGPPTGVVHNATRRIENPSSPIERLLVSGLLRPVDHQSVVLPREVALKLREGKLFRDSVSPHLPEWPEKSTGVGSELSVPLINRAAIGSAQELTSHVLAVAEFLDENEVAQLATGAIGKRDFRSLASRIGDAETCEFVLSLAAAGKLISRSSGRWIPTTQFERWADGDGWERWRALRAAWDVMLDWPDEDLNVLDPQRRQPQAGELRGAIAHQLAEAEDGQAITAEVLAARLSWLMPVRDSADLPETCKRVIDEAAWLGLLAFGRRSTLCEPLNSAESNPGFADFGDEVLVQSDLSLVAPAPLNRDTAKKIGKFAARVSHGATGVWRLTNNSIRQALDAGCSAESIRDWLMEHSATDVPAVALQLIDDVARTHGKIRVAAINCAIQVDDEDVLVTILNHQKSAELGLLKLGPTVLGATAEPEEVVGLLREIGLAPVPTSSAGVHYTPAPPRAPASLTEGRLTSSLSRARRNLPDPKILAQRLTETEGPLPATELRNRLDAAQAADSWVELEYVDQAGVSHRAEARILLVSEELVSIVEKSVGRKMLQISRISRVSA